MSKLSNLIKMAVSLMERNLNTKELMELLEVSERQIREYRLALDMAGISIESKKGPGGYYYIKNKALLDSLSSVRANYLPMLLELKDYIEVNKLSFAEEFGTMLNDINRRRDNNRADCIGFLSECYPAFDTDDEIAKLKDIKNAVSKRLKVEILYRSLSKKESSHRIIEPMKVYYYQGHYYCHGYCTKNKEMRDFKLIRMENYRVLDEGFELTSGHKIVEATNTIFRDGPIRIVLKIRHPKSVIYSEWVWGEDQKVVWHDDHSITLEVTRRGKPEIITWILGMGKEAEVLEPKELREEIDREVRGMGEQRQ